MSGVTVLTVNLWPARHDVLGASFLKIFHPDPMGQKLSPWRRPYRNWIPPNCCAFFSTPKMCFHKYAPTSESRCLATPKFDGDLG